MWRWRPFGVVWCDQRRKLQSNRLELYEFCLLEVYVVMDGNQFVSSIRWISKRDVFERLRLPLSWALTEQRRVV